MWEELKTAWKNIHLLYCETLLFILLPWISNVCDLVLFVHVKWVSDWAHIQLMTSSFDSFCSFHNAWFGCWFLYDWNYSTSPIYFYEKLDYLTSSAGLVIFPSCNYMLVGSFFLKLNKKYYCCSQTIHYWWFFSPAECVPLITWKHQ